MSLILVCLLSVAGCGLVKYKPEPLDADAVQASVRNRSLDDPAFQKYVHAMVPDRKPGVGGEWDLNMLTLTALYFNPAMQVANNQVSLRRGQLETASSYINPTMNVPLEHHSDTSGGRSSAWTLGGVIDFVYELRGKRAARIAGARAELEAARIHVLETAWDIRGRLHSAYMDYYLAGQKEKLAAGRLKLLRQKQALLQKRSAFGETGKEAVNRAELEAQQAQLTLAGDQVNVNDTWHALTALTGLPATAFANVSFSFAAFDSGAAEQLDAGDLQESALLHRADVVRALYEYRVAEQALKLEIEKQYPDITLSPGLIFDQGDKIWSLGASWILPLFNHNQGPIAEALAKRKIMQAEFLEMQTQLLNSLHAELNRYDKLLSQLSVFRVIQDRMEKQGRAIRNQYKHGYSDRLDLINTELKLNNSKRAVLSSRAELLKTVVRLEQLVQKPLPGETNIDKPLEFLYEWKQVPGLAENAASD